MVLVLLPLLLIKTLAKEQPSTSVPQWLGTTCTQQPLSVVLWWWYHSLSHIMFKTCIDVFILIYFFHFYFSFFSLTITRLLLNVKNVTWAVERCHLVFRKKKPGCCSSSGCSTTELLHSTFGSKRPSKSFPAGSRQPLYRRRVAAAGGARVPRGWWRAAVVAAPA